MLESVSPSPFSTRAFDPSVSVSDAIDPSSLHRVDPAAKENRQQDSNTTRADQSATKKDSVRISEEAREVAKLAGRDREVRAHEAAHAATGGRYAGAPHLTCEKGPDGKSYAVGGEVPIDVSAVSGDPLATLQKAQIVRAAALAPAQPSAQDMRIASRAAAMAVKASAELTAKRMEDGPGASGPAEPSASGDSAAGFAVSGGMSRLSVTA